MDNIQLSRANQTYISKKTEDKSAVSSLALQQPQRFEDGDNKMNRVFLGLAILGIAAVGIACVASGKKPKEVPNADEVQKLAKQFKDIDFSKGQAKLKNGARFTGVIEDTLKSGDKVIMEYTDGVIQKSTKISGEEKVVKEYTNGVISKKNGKIVNIKKLQNEAKEQQTKLKSLFKDDKISAEEFKKQTDEIKYKSKKQEVETQEIFNKKANAEKAEIDRIAREEAEAAQKVEEYTERIATEQTSREIQFDIESATEDMTINELEKHAKQLNKQIMEIRTNYDPYTTENFYAKKDKDLTAKLRAELIKTQEILTKKIKLKIMTTL